MAPGRQGARTAPLSPLSWHNVTHLIRRCPGHAGPALTPGSQSLLQAGSAGQVPSLGSAVPVFWTNGEGPELRHLKELQRGCQSPDRWPQHGSHTPHVPSERLRAVAVTKELDLTF